MGGKFSHVNRRGEVRMVSVSDKSPTERVAVASGRVKMSKATLAKLCAGTLAKGDGLAVARVAAISACKRAPDWVPLCHPLRLTGVEVDFTYKKRSVVVTVTVRCVDRTGAEMEALCGVSAACLTIYDMCKALERGIEIGRMRLESKHGGASGTWKRP